MVDCQEASLAKANEALLLWLHSWLIASLTLMAHTALIDDNLRKVPVYLVPAMVSVAV